MTFTGKPESYLDSTIENDDFYPELSVGDFQRVYRVPVDRGQEAVEHQLRIARNSVNTTLIRYQERWLLAGYPSLEAMDTNAGNGSDKQGDYLHAVFLRAKAELLHDFQTFSRRDEAQDMAKDGQEIYRSLLARSTFSLRRVKGLIGTVTADLL